MKKYSPHLFLLTILTFKSVVASSDISYSATAGGTPVSWSTLDSLDNPTVYTASGNKVNTAWSVNTPVPSVSLDSQTTLTLERPTSGSTLYYGSAFVSGAATDEYAAPVYTTAAQAKFFGQNTAGSDASQYLSVFNGGTATLTFNTPQAYLGFQWGSPDNYNSVSFYNGDTLLGTVTGTEITAPLGGIGGHPELYANFTATTDFTSVVFSSTGNSFEVDNIAHSALSVAPGAPAPPLTACLAFAGVLLLQTLRRKTVA